MPVPRQAVMEEPSTEPLSPRGTCLEILTHVALLYASPPASAPGLQPHMVHQSAGKCCQARGLHTLLLIFVIPYLLGRNNSGTERFI